MQKVMAMQREAEIILEPGSLERKQPLADRPNTIHKRMERWIRLQQFVFGLPDDYAYAVCLSGGPGGRQKSFSLVRVGYMSWFGTGAGADRQHSLAVALLNTEEAISANSTSVFLHRMGKIFGWRKKYHPRPLAPQSGEEIRERSLMAG
jgi:hypothetical protein